MTAKQVAKLYAGGASIAAIKKQSGHDFYTIKRLIVEGGVELRPPRGRSRLTQAQVVELYAKHSLEQIAELNGTSRTQVWRTLKLAGVVMRSRGGADDWGRTHGYTQRARDIGMRPNRYVRARAVLKLGGACRACGNSDLRVLQLNHINGEGKTSRNDKVTYGEAVRILNGETLPYIEVLCANCNVIHEYDRGSISDVTSLVVADHLACVKESETHAELSGTASEDRRRRRGRSVRGRHQE